MDSRCLSQGESVVVRKEQRATEGGWKEEGARVGQSQARRRSNVWAGEVVSAGLEHNGSLQSNSRVVVSGG